MRSTKVSSRRRTQKEDALEVEHTRRDHTRWRIHITYEGTTEYIWRGMPENKDIPGGGHIR